MTDPAPSVRSRQHRVALSRLASWNRIRLEGGGEAEREAALCSAPIPAAPIPAGVTVVTPLVLLQPPAGVL